MNSTTATHTPPAFVNDQRHQDYQSAPPRSQLEELAGPMVLDFGTNWCGFCQVARPLVDAVLSGHPEVRHLRVEDGPGRPLGRSFGVKLWPTLVFLADGREIGRLVRPSNRQAVEEAVSSLRRACGH